MKQRKIAYISYTFLADCDIPLLHELSKETWVDYYLLVTYTFRQGTLIDLTLKEKGGIYSGTAYPELNMLGRWIDLSHVYIVNIPADHNWQWVNFRVSWQLMRHLKKKNYDLIHLTWPLSYNNFSLYLLHKKMVITMHDPLPHSSQTTLRNRFQRYWCMRLTPHFILLNKTQREQFIKTYAIDESVVHQSQLSIYTHLRQSAVAPPLCSPPYILFVGSIMPHKGVEYLCEAMAPITADMPDMHVVIAGKGHLYFDTSNYESNPSYLFVNRYITNEELVSLITNSRAVVCPYIDATQSGVIMSAFALSKPVIATNVGALPEMIEDGRHGYLVAPKDSKALEEAIRRIIQPGIAEEMSANIATDYSQGARSWHAIARGMLEIYSYIITEE
jgi:glycosyltransferase involved in cell wall biosynthesis